MRGSLLFFCAPAAALQLFSAAYPGTISTLQFQPNKNSFSLTITSTSTACAVNSSWLTLEKSQGLSFCNDRGYTTPNGILNSLQVEADGSLVALDRILTPVGAVSSVLYDNNTALAVAFYSSSSMGSFDVQNAADMKALQLFEYTLATPGADPTYETAPHPHEAILDPTSRFILIPDLGSDLIHLYQINPATKLLTPLSPYHVPKGSGPRHAEFLVAHGKTYLYVVSQLTNVLTAYDVTYGLNSICLTPFQTTSLLKTSHGPDLQFYSAAAEIHITPDHKFIIVSQRNDTNFNITNPSSSAKTIIPSDSLLSFSINSTGNFRLIDTFPAGGSFPRQFSIDSSGKYVAVGLQNDGRVVILTRNVSSGKFENIAAGINITGQVVSTIWDE